MVSDQTKWVAEKLSARLLGEARQKFLEDLKHNPEYVVEVFKHDIEELLMQYVIEEREAGFISTDPGNSNSFVACTKHIVKYMQDELLKDELAQIV